ncbi:MAG: hypothetical protein CW338_05155 [Clostridiales bacterium]|nr:hypothetical protein [Clostridiales bacterium]
MKRKWRIVFFLLGIAGLVLMVYKAWPIDWETLLTTKVLLILLVQLGIWAVIYFLHILVYKQILGDEYYKQVGMFRLLKIVISGFALNNVTPGGLVGGEPYRIMELKPYCGTEKATSTTLTFTVFYTIGHLMLWCIGSIVYFALGFPGDTFFDVIMVITFLLTALACTAFIRSEKQGFIMPVLKFAAKLPLAKKPVSKLLEKHGESFATIDDEISAFSRDRRHFFTALALELASRLLEGFEYFVIIFMLGADISYWGGLLTMSFASLVGNVFFFIPMQASTREGGMAIVLAWLGISDDIGVMTGLLYRARDLLCIVLGIAFILINKRSRAPLSDLKKIIDENSSPANAGAGNRAASEANGDSPVNTDI